VPQVADPLDDLEHLARVLWEDDGEEHVDTVALGCIGRNVYVRMSDTRYQLRAVWLDADDVTRR
jgi:hypothetical protein